MKTHILTFLFLSAIFILNAQQFEWAKSFGGTSADYSIDIITDASGNVYTAGSFQGTIDFDPGVGVFNLTSNGTVIQKMDVSGNFLWAKSLLGTGFRSITTDASGNVYTAGIFTGTIDFDPGVGTFNITSNGVITVFVQKMDSSGNFLWAKSFGGFPIGSSNFLALTTDASGNVYTAGSFSDTADFDPGVGVFNLTSNGGFDAFIQKMDSSGNFLWAKSMGGSVTDHFFTLTTDASGNVYTAGIFTGTIDFDPGVGVFNLTSNGTIIQKMDASGNFLWAKSLPGTLPGRTSKSITTDTSGNVYTTGAFYGLNVDFDPGAGIFYLSSNGSTPDAFVQKMDALGNFLWVKSFGGNPEVEAYSITTDASGNVYTAGSFQGTIDFDPGAGVFNLTSNGGSDAFVQKMDALGNFLWAKFFGGTSDEEAYSIITDASGNVYTTGVFQGTVDFDPGVGTFNITSNGDFDGFVQKWSQCNTTFQTDIQTACISYTWINGITYYSSNNIATDTLTNSAGCDSIVTLNLTITNSSSATDIVSSCNSYTWIDGVTYTASNNTATDTLTNSVGCDSVVTLNLTITNSSSATDVVSSCNSYTWIDGVTYTASNNTATDTLTNSAGCDSVLTLNLTITNSPLISQPINQTVNIGNNAQFQFLTSGSLLNYQWQMDVGIGYVNLSNAGQFSGADTNLLTVSNVNMANNNTDFRCIVTDLSACKDTTNSVKLFVSSGTSIIEQTNSLVNLYPNPTSDFVTINLANKSKGQVIVLDLLGKVVLNKQFNSNQIQLSLKSIESKGTYLVKIIDSNGNVIANKKLIYQ